MSLPTVAAILLTRDRPAMSRRAVECFRAQTYPAAKRLLVIFDSGDDPQWTAPLLATSEGCTPMRDNEAHLWAQKQQGQPIGTLRNLANEWAASGVVGTFGRPDILMHFDSDDFSHPRRMEEQVAALPGVEATGYNEMLFWDSTSADSHGAWIYRGAPSYLIGTSLAYWRATWERKRFQPLMTGEDSEFQKGLRVRAVSAGRHDPRMIGAIHGENTTCRVVWNLDPKTGKLTSAKEWRNTILRARGLCLYDNRKKTS